MLPFIPTTCTCLRARTCKCYVLTQHNICSVSVTFCFCHQWMFCKWCFLLVFLWPLIRINIAGDAAWRDYKWKNECQQIFPLIQDWRQKQTSNIGESFQVSVHARLSHTSLLVRTCTFTHASAWRTRVCLQSRSTAKPGGGDGVALFWPLPVSQHQLVQHVLHGRD